MARNYELIWSRRALVDLTSTLDYIAQDEPVAATDLARAQNQGRQLADGAANGA